MAALVSIVIPMYNSQTVIGKCLASVMHQSYKQIEIIVVDDGSTDGSGEIVQEYQTRDNRIKYIRLEHCGVSKARNAGIDAAQGRYITFVDSDDYAEDNMVEEYMNAMDHFYRKKINPSFVMVGMHVDVFCGTMEETDHLVDGKEEYQMIAKDRIAYLCWCKLFNFITNKIYSLEMIKDYRIRFDDQIQIGEDLQFNLDYLKTVPGDIGMVNKALYHYVRVNEESLSLIYYENAIEHTKEVYANLLQYLQKQEGTTEDDIMVIKSILLVDWTSRLTALYEHGKGTSERKDGRKKVQSEICTKEFQNLLEEVHSCGKVSHLRYYSLKMKNYGLYCFMRKIYRMLK